MPSAHDDGKMAGSRRRAHGNPRNRVERRIAAPPSHTTVQAMSHTAVSDLCLTKAEYMKNKLFF